MRSSVPPIARGRKYGHTAVFGETVTVAVREINLGVRTRAFAENTFYGKVSKIAAESERDENNQATYRVELTIENTGGALRPGMTAFARIDFGSRMNGSILAHKIKQVLRPELWLF